MALRDELPREGAWLFRWRSYLPLLLLSVVLFQMKDFDYIGRSHRLDLAWDLFCLAVSLLGLGIRALTIGYTPRGTSGRNTRGQVADVLNTTGMYAVVRHPLYLGNFFMWLGVALFPHNIALVLLSVLAFWLYYERIMFAEEAFLQGKFGAAFQEWAARTPAFIPDLRRWETPDLSFSLRNVLRREYSGLLAVVAIFTLLEVLGDRVVEGTWTIDPIWLGIFAVGTTTSLVLRTLKRRSRILDVAGR